MILMELVMGVVLFGNISPPSQAAEAVEIDQEQYGSHTPCQRIAENDHVDGSMHRYYEEQPDDTQGTYT